MQMEFMKVDDEQAKQGRGKTPDLEGVAGMFDG